MTQTASTSEQNHIAALEAEVATLRRVLGMKDHLNDLLKRYAMDQRDKLVVEKLAACSPDNHVWIGVLSLLDMHILFAHAMSRDHNSTNEAMRSAVGRESSLEDFRNQLLEFWAKANKPVKAS